MSSAQKSKRMWVCGPCRARKTRCDGKRPVCGSCSVYEKDCFYPENSLDPRPHKRHRRASTTERPSTSSTSATKSQETQTQQRATSVEQYGDYPASNTNETTASVSSVTTRSGRAEAQRQINNNSTTGPAHGHPQNSPGMRKEALIDSKERQSATEGGGGTGTGAGATGSTTDGAGDDDLSDYVTVDESGNVIVTGHTRTLYALPRTPPHNSNSTSSSSSPGPVRQNIPEYYISAELTANAARLRQQESVDRARLLSLGTYDGIPVDLILHLVDIYWSRHHFLHLVYRPAFMRELAPGLLEEPGFRPRYFSKLLLYTILAISGRYSYREDVRDPSNSSERAGSMFFERAKALLVNDLGTCNLPTAISLLLLGNALVGFGQLDIAWLYTGMGIRILIHIGLHVDVTNSAHLRNCSAEHIEICRRVFWGAFLCEKLQSLYLGRPIAMHERDVQVPKIFLDTYEEFEIWTPPRDDHNPNADHKSELYTGQPSYSISNFKALCGLAEICGQIISNFYAVKSTREPIPQLIVARELIHRDLSKWEKNLPKHLYFKPWADPNAPVPPLHIIILHTLHYSLIILLERPFVADGHLRSVGQRNASESWKRCSVAAFRIAKLLEAYDRPFSLEKAPYQLCYSAYVAATVLVRNASASTSFSTMMTSTMTTLDESTPPESVANNNINSNTKNNSTTTNNNNNNNNNNSASTSFEEQSFEESNPSNPRLQSQERKRVMSALQTCLLTFRKMRSWVYGADRLERIIRGLMARMHVNEVDEDENVDENGTEEKNDNNDHEPETSNLDSNGMTAPKTSGIRKTTESEAENKTWVNQDPNVWPNNAPPSNTPDLRVDLETIFRSFNIPSQELPSPTNPASTAPDPNLNVAPFADPTFFQDNRTPWGPPTENRPQATIPQATSRSEPASSTVNPIMGGDLSNDPFSGAAGGRPSADVPPSVPLYNESNFTDEMDQLYGFLIPSDENPLL